MGTANYGWTKPVVGGSVGTWGGLLNTIIDAVDALLARPKTIRNESYKLVDVGDVNGSAALDLSTGNFFRVHLTGNSAISFVTDPNQPVGEVMFFMVEVVSAGAYTITWPGSVKWPGGSLPALTDSGVDVIAFYTHDAGTTWRGAVAQADSR